MARLVESISILLNVLLLAGVVIIVLLHLEQASPPPQTPPPPSPPAPEPTPQNVLREPTFTRPLLVDGSHGDWAPLRNAVDHSRRYLGRLPGDREIVFGPRTATAAELRAALDEVHGWLGEDLSATDFAHRIAGRFDLLESSDPEVLVTGYYEPMIDGSLSRHAGYDVPIYTRPPGGMTVDLGAFADDLSGRKIYGRFVNGRLVPFPERSEIRQGARLGSRILAWARDPVDLFFLEIQGSGTLRLPDGREQRIGYAGSNGRPYRSIGKLLIDRGEIPRERMSMQALRVWLDANPEKIHDVLDHNASQVFFRKLDSAPVGSLGVPVTPGRSIATDRRLFPKGALAFLVTSKPKLADDGTTVSEGSLNRFVLNQDTGGAIRGPGRVDFFWGRGNEAAARAGAMKQGGRLFFLVPKEAR